MSSVDYRFWLVRSSDLGQIADLTTNTHNKDLQLALNQGGTFNCNMNLLDDKCIYVEEHKTAFIIYRNQRDIWSGPVFDCVEESDASSDSLKITAMGWFELFNKRILHTGEEFEKMIAKSKSTYVPLGEESSQELVYANKPMSFIAADLINRANIDVPTGVTLGEVPETNSINLRLQQFESIGQQLTKLTAIESGFDFEIDPLTKKFNMYYNEIRGGIVGKGIDRGSRVRFTYPGNCSKAVRTSRGTKTQNRTEVIGTYGVGKDEEITSIQENGLFENSVSLSDVVNENILIAYAVSETLTLAYPFKVITFQPKSLSEIDNKTPTVPRPFEDYEIGDIGYTIIKKGKRFQVGLQNPQPVRLFSFNIGVDDNARETISNIQTTYTS